MSLAPLPLGLLCTLVAIGPPLDALSQDPESPSVPRTVTGITEPIRDATLGSPTGGIISVHHFKEGETVEAGEIILELHHETESIEVSRQETILASTEKRLERVTKLHESSANVSDEELEEAQSKFKIAKAEYDLAVTQLEQRLTRAPFTGIISDLFTLEVGEAVQIEYPIARLIDASRCLFVAQVEATQAGGLTVGTQVKLDLTATGKPVQVDATVNFVAPTVDPSSGLLKVTATFDNTAATIRPGVGGTMTWNAD